MGRIKLKIGILLLGWLWLQPVLARHQLESLLPSHDDHGCLVCALHLDGKQAISPTPYCFPGETSDTPVVVHMQQSADCSPPHRYAIRAPPELAFTNHFI